MLPVRLQLLQVEGVDATADFNANIELTIDGGAWLPAAIALAMATDVTLAPGALVDKTAAKNAMQAQAVLAGWYPNLHAQAHEFRIDDREVVPAAGVGAFFSGGVDSFFSALQLRDELTHLIFVHGFDIPIHNAHLARVALAEVRSAASELGLTLIEITTNIREISDPIIGWGDKFHGAAMATVGLLLSGQLHKIYIPSSYHNSQLFPWGSHPELDPLWSNGRVRFVHHGSEYFRTDKVRAIASSEIALRHLRVCWKNPQNAYNCGRCEKCIRTMITLDAVGALKDCATLPSNVHLRSIVALRTIDRRFAEANLALLEGGGSKHWKVRTALRVAIWASSLWAVARSVRARARRGSKAAKSGLARDM